MTSSTMPATDRRAPRPEEPGRPHAARLSRTGGATLVELVVAVAVLAIVVTMIGTLLLGLSSFYFDAMAQSSLMESGKVGSERLVETLSSARLLAFTGTGGAQAVPTFVVPVVIGGDVVSATGEVNWGAEEAGGGALDTVASPHRITVNLDATGSASEQALSTDINADGDLDDTFQTGSVVLQTTGGVQTTVVPGRVVLGDANLAAVDLDADGQVDPLFQINGEAFVDADGNGVWTADEAFTDANGNGVWDGTLDLAFLLVGRDDEGRGQLALYRTSIVLANNQQ